MSTYLNDVISNIFFLRLIEVFSYHSKQYDQALDIIRTLDILPLQSPTQNREYIQNKVIFY